MSQTDHHLDPSLEQEASDFDQLKHAKVDRGALAEKFTELYLERSIKVEHGDYMDMLRSCYRDAGGPDTNNYTRSARQLLRRAWPQIEEALKTKLRGAASIGLHTLIELAQHGKNETVRQKAATELLNKAGFGETMKLQVNTSVEELSDEDLQKQIQEAMKESGLKVVKA